MTDRANFGASTTADEVLHGIDLSGRTVFITGAASGIGTEAARAMAAKGAHVVIVARDQAKANAAAAAVGEDRSEMGGLARDRRGYARLGRHRWEYLHPALTAFARAASLSEFAGDDA